MMRLFFVGPRVLGISPGISVRPEDLRAAHPKPFFLPLWTNMFFLAIWACLTAWAVLTMEPGPYLLQGQIAAAAIFGLVVGVAWLFLTVNAALLRAGQR